MSADVVPSVDFYDGPEEPTRIYRQRNLTPTITVSGYITMDIPPELLTSWETLPRPSKQRVDYKRLAFLPVSFAIGTVAGQYHVSAIYAGLAAALVCVTLELVIRRFR